MADQQPQGRNSEGVVVIRHPRSDGAIEQGWIRKPTGTLFEAVNAYGWYSESQSYRPYAKQISYGPGRNVVYDFYQTSPEQGWIAKANLTGTTNLYEAVSFYGWYAESQSFRSSGLVQFYGERGRRTELYYQTAPEQGWLRKPTGTLFEAVNAYGWYTYTSQSTPHHPARDLERWDQDDATFDVIVNSPAINEWVQDFPRTAPGPRYLRDSGQSVGWVYPSLPVVFDPSPYNWVVPADRLGAGAHYERETNFSLPWMAIVTPPFDPALQAWIIPADRMAHALGRWTPETNPTYGWITPELLLVFDPALYPGIAQLVGWSTPKSASLSIPRAVFVYDLSWLHNVIPLTDPVAATFIRLRPIAPIVRARRRRRR